MNNIYLIFTDNIYIIVNLFIILNGNDTLQ